MTAANITLAANYIGGAINGQLSMRPTGGAPMDALVTGNLRQWTDHAWSARCYVNSQGDARMTGVSQRHECEVAFGGAYEFAPGVQLVGESVYTHRHEGVSTLSTMPRPQRGRR
jgi:hypothetical protein